MKYVSTRGAGPVSLDQALLDGLAADGGLYVPERWPGFTLQQFARCEVLADVAEVFLRPFFAGSRLLSELPGIVAGTFSFPIPTRALPVQGGNAALLELFHGPTAAFKDVGARFLAACLTRLHQGNPQPLTILVATSGDTGAAVASAFDGLPGIRVVVLFPAGRVSPRQQQQLCCWGDNVLSLSVRGSFDDCQALVKSLMSDAGLRRSYSFSSANSINIGRLLPQCTYYAGASLQHFRKTGRRPSFIVPTGNLGNALACLIARHAGLPIATVVLATNANRLIADYQDGADWLPRTSVTTLASAMDVGNPSNMERLLNLFGSTHRTRQELRVFSASDEAIRQQIRKDFRRFGFPFCPHTATAAYAYDRLGESERREQDWILVATAHAAKFEGIVEPLIGEVVKIPETLAALLQRPSRAISINADPDSLIEVLAARFAT